MDDDRLSFTNLLRGSRQVTVHAGGAPPPRTGDPAPASETTSGFDPAPGDEDEGGRPGLDLARLTAVVRRRARLLLLASLAAAVISTPVLYFHRLHNRIYRATAVLAQRGATQQIKLEEAIYIQPKQDPRTVAQIARLPQNLQRVIDRLHLKQNTEQLRRALKVEHERKSSFVRIIGMAPGAAAAADLANVMAQVVQDRIAEIGKADASAYLALYRRQLRRAEGTLNGAAAALTRFHRDNGIVELDIEIKVLLKKVVEVDLAAYEARIRAKAARLRSRSLGRRMKRSSRSAIQSVTYQSANGTKLAELKGTLAGFRGRYTDDNPKVKKARQQVARLRQVAAEDNVRVGYTTGVDPVRAALEVEQANQHATVEAQLDVSQMYRSRQQVLNKRLKSLSSKKRRYSQLLRRQEFAAALVSRIFALMEQAAAATKVAAPTFALVEPAEPPRRAEPSKIRYVALAIPLLVLLAGLALVLSRELADGRIATAREVMAVTELPVLLELAADLGEQALLNNYRHAAVSLKRIAPSGSIGVCAASEPAAARSATLALAAAWEEMGVATTVRDVSRGGDYTPRRPVAGREMVTLPPMLASADARIILEELDYCLLVVASRTLTRAQLSALAELARQSTTVLGVILTELSPALVSRPEFGPHKEQPGLLKKIMARLFPGETNEA
jgi:uncharacterized protein involved in exopolysaccharide biosynthesis